MLYLPVRLLRLLRIFDDPPCSGANSWSFKNQLKN